jgi:hypothetical protein
LVQVTWKCDIGPEQQEEVPLTEEGWESEIEVIPEPTKRKRRKVRRYPKPVCTPEQKATLWEHQGRI